ncbi:MAG: hypothetical protein AAFR91_06805 [Pseudomonadota bacterium]
MNDASRRKDPVDAFQNPDTRERWEWVQQAIGFAEDDCAREFEYRNERDVEGAPSPFIE